MVLERQFALVDGWPVFMTLHDSGAERLAVFVTTDGSCAGMTAVHNGVYGTQLEAFRRDGTTDTLISGIFALKTRARVSNRDGLTRYVGSLRFVKEQTLEPPSPARYMGRVAWATAYEFYRLYAKSADVPQAERRRCLVMDEVKALAGETGISHLQLIAELAATYRTETEQP